MAHVIFLRGVNVGGHRVFRPTTLARELKHLDVVNIGAAGTFVVREPIAQAQLRAEVARRLPFEAEIIICPGRSVARLVSRDFFAGQSARADLVRFVSVMARRARVAPSLPLHLPSRNGWLVRVLAVEDRFVVGVYRRHMKAVGHLGQLDRVFGTPVTTRNWNTLTAVARALNGTVVDR
jgi:uncharacterized protein (DUF1697 family)